MSWGGKDFSERYPLLWGIDGNPYLNLVERRFWLDLWRAPVVDAVAETGIEVRFYGPIQAMTVAALPDSPLLNLLLGTAAFGAVSEGHLEAALEWTESLGIDCRVPVAGELSESAEAEDLLNRRGYRRTASLVRFVRDASPPRFPEPSGIEVDPVDEFLEGFSDYMGDGLGLDLTAHSFFDSLPGRADWRSYVALDEHELGIGAASMMVDYEVARLGFAATTEDARSKGAHLALLRRRILDAAAARCKVLFAETEEPLDDLDGPSPAARNLVRAGFHQAATSQVWRPG